MIKNVHKRSVIDLLNPKSNIQYLPLSFQHGYSWTLPQWESFFDNLVEQEPGFFLGSMLFVNTSSDSIISPTVEILDGYNRFMTLCVFYTAIYTVLDSHFVYLDDKQREEFMRTKKMLENEEGKMRLVPPFASQDNLDYENLLTRQKILSGESLNPVPENSLIYQAFRYFKKRTSLYIKNFANHVIGVLDLIHRLDYAVMISIEVGCLADGFLLYDTMNHQNHAPSAAELIKNILFSKFESTDSIQKAAEQWTRIETALGNHLNQQQFFMDSMNIHLLLGNITLQSSERVSLHNLVRVYEEAANADPRKVMQALLEDVQIYAAFSPQSHNIQDNEVSRALTRLSEQNARSANILLLYLLKQKQEHLLEDVHLLDILSQLQNFFILRNELRFPPQRDLQENFYDMVKRIRGSKSKAGEVTEAIRRELSNM